MENETLNIKPDLLCSEPVQHINGEIVVPGDKSISHRALLLSAIAEGDSYLHGFLNGEDCLATMNALRSMGIQITTNSNKVKVCGVGANGLTEPKQSLDLGNSGTAMRLLAGMLSSQPFSSVLIGDDSLSKRPMSRITEPLSSMGAKIDSNEGCPPLVIAGGQKLRGINYRLPVASAQVKSALLIAGLWAEGRTTVHSPGPSRDHTEIMLKTMGVELSTGNDHELSLDGPVALTARNHEIPGDFSSAAFFIVAGLLASNEGLLIKNVGINPTRTGLLEILRLMGGSIEILNSRESGNELVADLLVKKSQLRGIEIDAKLVPLAIDEFPVLFVAAAFADGITSVNDAKELRYKESDRLSVMAEGLNTLGVKTKETKDGLRIKGGALSGGYIDSHGDHRVAMSFAVAGIAAKDSIYISRAREINTSFPDFLSIANSVGFAIRPHTISTRH
ncbi:MAG: 3-phosphoshikimate 1-carboxyvinyltransferase [Rhodospirillaceae bacterium]|nr:3-phosphoshikimate 1-carboxyvinyltransferase [Rhodospirillaceae bacterium]